MTNGIVNFMIDSPKRLSLLDFLSSLNSYVKLKPLCPTRWTVRATSMNVLKINYSLVKTALVEIIIHKCHNTITTGIDSSTSEYPT